MSVNERIPALLFSTRPGYQRVEVHWVEWNQDHDHATRYTYRDEDSYGLEYGAAIYRGKTERGSLGFSRVYSSEKQVETMWRTVEKVRRHTRRLTERYGQPATFGQEVARIADALGIKHILFTPNERQGVEYQSRRVWYDGKQFKAYPPGEAIQIIDDQVSDMIERMEREKADSVA